MSRLKSLLQLLFIAKIFQNVIGVLAVCSQGCFEMNGLCVQQTAQCPANYFYVNGMCYLSVSGQCGANQISVNGQCCTLACIQTCQNQQSTCNCCGPPIQNAPPAPPCQQVAQPSLCPAVTPCAQNQVVAPYATPCQQPTQPCPNQSEVPCHNQIVAPCPNQVVAPCPNQAVVPCSNQAVAPCPNQAVVPCQQTTQPCTNQAVASCSNQAVAPCPNQGVVHCQQTTQPCTNQAVAPCSNQAVAPCPNQAVVPCQQTTQPCTNQAVTPCSNQAVAPCPNQAAAPCPNQPTAPCPTQPTTPCPNQPSTPCPNPPAIPCPQPPMQPAPYQPPVTPYPTLPTPYPTLPPPPPPPPTITTTTPAPGLIKQCPDGTVLINGICRMIYCVKGIYKNNRCIQTQCPPGTVWSGIKCDPPKPIEHSITFHNTVLTQFNRTAPDVIVNNVNNNVLNNTINVYEPSAPATKPCGNSDDDDDDCDTSPDEPPTQPQPMFQQPPPNQKCCTVVTPRACRPNVAENHWNCYNRRYRRCGDFCIAPTIYLKIDQPRHMPPYTYMPPNPEFADCRQTRTCPESDNFYDCSGCAVGRPESCSSYCYSSPCGTRKCLYYDQRQYCSNYPGQSGCQQQDGCFEDWCGAY